jgi:CubicO group peptidase (beta-lactamase class C family)
MEQLNSTPDLVKKIHNLRPVISELLDISGSPGLSIGVLHHGEVIYTNHHGRKDVAKVEPPNDDTVYYIASLTKVLTAAAMALLVDEGKGDWNTKIRAILPEFKQRKDIVGQEANVIDVLSNRTGLPLAFQLWGLRNGEYLLPKNEDTRMCCEIQAVKPFRKNFLYSNWNYALVTAVIEKLSGKKFGTFVQEKFLEPLHMRRTTINDLANDNIAMAHAVYDNGTACRIPFPHLSDETGSAGAAAGKSSIKDLLIMYKSLLASYKHQKESGSSSTPGSPFRDLQTVFSPQIKISNSQSNRQTYCLGLYKTELPGNVGVASINNSYLGRKNEPHPGAQNVGLEVYHHTGNWPGYAASMFLIPSSETAIVVLTNSIALSDPTDFTGRLILSVVLNENIPTNFAELSKMVKQSQFDSYSKLNIALQTGRTAVPPHYPLASYEGRYFNSMGNYVIEVQAEKHGLLMIAQGKKFTRFSLLPYDGNTFYWPANREHELCKNYGFPLINLGYHKVVFAANADGFIESLAWDFDPGAKPYVFQKSFNKLTGTLTKL